MSGLSRLLAFLFISWQCCSRALCQLELAVETEDAVYHGRVLSLNVQVQQQQTVAHLGIPYAQPPVQMLRFAAPSPWRPALSPKDKNASGKLELNATRAGPACLQRPDLIGTPSRMSEDCLYLNIQSPTRRAAPGVYRPVLVWLHGGYFETGAVSDPDQNGDAIAWDLVATRQNLLVVEVAYRLGVFGFLAEPDAGNGNAGLKDQQLALVWVARNIGYFGGSNGSVTLAGLDAGAAAVGWHMLSEGSRGLFQRTFLLGGSPLANWAFVRDREALRVVHERFYNLANCTDTSERLACLRNISAEKLNAYQAEFNRAFDGVEFPVVVDGQFLKKDPIEAFVRGEFETKATVLGATSLEGIQLGYRTLRAFNTSKPTLTGQVYLNLLTETFRYFPRFPEELTSLGREFLTLQLTAYSGENLGERNFDLLTKALSQRVTVCESNMLADLLLQADNGRGEVFVYQLDEPDGNTDEYRGAGHGKDAAYFLGEPLRRADYDQYQRTLSGTMMDQLVTFLTTGNVSQTGWHASSITRHEFYRLRAPRSANLRSEIVGGGFSRQECRMWTEILPRLGVISPTTTPKTDEDAEAKFWARCNATINLVSMIVMGIGGGLVLLLILCVVIVARGRRGSSHDLVELYQRVKPAGK